MTSLKKRMPMANQVWSEKWRELSSSWDSEDEEREDEEGAEASTGNQTRGEANMNDVDSNGNEIRRSARPRRAAAKAASGDLSGLSDDEPPSKRRAHSSATPSRGRALNERRQAESHTRAPMNKADEKRLRKRETNKNSARKMRLQRKEELALLMKEKHTLVDQVTEKSKELKRLYASMNSLQSSNNEMEVGFHNLQRSNELLVEELLSHITFLRNAAGKVLDPHAIPPIIARFAKCLTNEEASQMMDESEDGARAHGRGRARGSPKHGNGDDEDRTVYIRVDPRPGTKVQIIKPHAMKPIPSRLGLPPSLLAMQDDSTPKHFQATRPRTGPSKQSTGHALGHLGGASSPSVQTPGPSQAPPSGSQSPRVEPPLLRLASDLVEGSSVLTEELRRSREGSHPTSGVAGQGRVVPPSSLPPTTNSILATLRSVGSSQLLHAPVEPQASNTEPLKSGASLDPPGKAKMNGAGGSFVGFQPLPRSMTRLA